VLWHRANVLYLEQMIGCPVPYWNFMSPHATQDGSPEAGIPQPFKDLTYIHPETGEERPNPLRFAAAKDGRNKACVAGGSDARAEDCRYVARDPLLYTSGDDCRTERQQKLDLVAKFQEQVVFALQWPLFSTPQGTPGYPWANIQTFDPPPPDSDYPHRTDFDGLYEQPHDNFHGWVGPDMADNAYTAFDPIFWSYHANIDRIFEEWNRAHPASQFTANVPLRPFVGPRAAGIDPANPEPYVYTTIGDMAADSRSLGYDYAPPVEPDVSTIPDEAQDYTLYVAFGGIKCLRDTYLVDIFLNLSRPEPQDKHNHNKAHYVGRLTRLGMGVEDDHGRCLAWGVTRVLDASRAAHRLGILPPSEVTADLLVTDASTDRRVEPAEYRRLPGFTPTLTWVQDSAADSPSG
jgi:tyrosinase